jgi:hypothetical protein
VLARASHTGPAISKTDASGSSGTIRRYGLRISSALK